MLNQDTVRTDLPTRAIRTDGKPGDHSVARRRSSLPARGQRRAAAAAAPPVAGMLLKLGAPANAGIVRVLADENIAEAEYKAFARAFRQAKALDPLVDGIPSTKGAL